MSGMSSLIRLSPSRIGRPANTRFIATSTLSLSPSGWARAGEVPRPGRGGGEPEPLAVDLEGPIGVHDDVAVAIVGARPRDGHLLVPAVLAAHGIGLDREGQVLMDARVLPPDPGGVGVVAHERSHALELAHPPLPALDLLELDERAGPALASRVWMKPPAPQVVRALDHAR